MPKSVWKWLVAALVILVVSCTLSVQAQTPSHTVVVDSDVMNNLKFMTYAADNRVEVELCVYGDWHQGAADTVFLRELRLAWVDSAGPHIMYFNTSHCGKDNLLGFVHSHLSDSVCDLSDVDKETFLNHEHVFTFLVCNDTLKTFWKQDVIDQLRETYGSVRGFLSTSEAQEDTPDTSYYRVTYHADKARFGSVTHPTKP